MTLNVTDRAPLTPRLPWKLVADDEASRRKLLHFQHYA